MPNVRPAVLPDDADAIAAIDTSFDTHVIYDVRLEGDSFVLTAQSVDPPVTKTFPIDGITTTSRVPGRANSSCRRH